MRLSPFRTLPRINVCHPSSTFWHQKTTSRYLSGNMSHPIQSLYLKSRLLADYPWTKFPLIVSAPMRVMSGPALALAVSAAGGIGFIGPGLTPESTAADLEEASTLLSSSSTPFKAGDGGGGVPAVIPVGVGFQLWNGSLEAASDAVKKYRPAAVWLFAPRDGQAEINEWTRELRRVSGGATKIWLQVGTISEAVAACVNNLGAGEKENLRPDVLVLQGGEAGGHGRTGDATPVGVLVPEVLSTLAKEVVDEVPVFAAGGISDGRGVASALCLGASGAVMGTRFLACTEARIKRGYQDAVLAARDGGTTTVKTHLYNHLRGTFGWPEDQWTPRTIVNKSWEEKKAGVEFDELKKRHDEALKRGDVAWGMEEGRTATYAGMGVGLVNEVKGAKEIVEEVRDEAKEILKALVGGL